MPEGSDSRVEALYEEYQRQRANLAELQRRMTEVSATAVSPRREVSVTVGNQGVITELKFPTSAYKRLAPTELAGILTATIDQAREQATAQAAGIMAPLLPAGIDATAILNGRGKDAIDLLPEEPTPHPLVQEQLNRWS